MEIVLHVVDKRANELTPAPSGAGLTVKVELRGDVSMTSPTFALTRAIEASAYNYVYVPIWRRYYFIENMSTAGNVWYLYTKEDFLTSWQRNILDAELYCLRSSNKYDETITDTKFPAPVTVTTLAQNVKTPWLGINEGNFIVAISSGGNNNTHIGTNCYYVLNNDEMTQFMHDVMGSGEFSITGIADSIAKTMINPLQYIQSCTWIPCDINAKTTSVSSIDFGWWSSSASARVLQLDDNSDCVTEYTLQFTPDVQMTAAKREYLKYAPYNALRITAYPFGVIQMPKEVVSEYMNGNAIKLRIVVDNLSGMGTLLITSDRIPSPLYVTTAQIGVDIPVGQVLQDYAGSAISAVGALSSLSTGSVIGGVAGVKSAIDNLAPNVNVSGASGGFAQLMLDDTWTLTRTYHTVEPATNLLGEPCCKSVKVETLTGYAQFAEAEIYGNMLLSEKDAIAQLLEGGIYIG